ncbi:hypothetical protein FV228_30810, partial [Methylobacterium sp. WL18]
MAPSMCASARFRAPVRSLRGRCCKAALSRRAVLTSCHPAHPDQREIEDQMIKKLLLASAATALLTGAASAADLPR